jgi:uncharacterized protein YndB with AHSA1/START domain
MTGANRAGKTSATIRVDQFVAAAPEKVWRLLTEPELMRRWWAEGEVAAVVGHQFTLDMPGYGKQPCKVLEVDPPHRFVYTFTPAWTLTWVLQAEGSGTRVSWSTAVLTSMTRGWPTPSSAWDAGGAMASFPASPRSLRSRDPSAHVRRSAVVPLGLQRKREGTPCAQSSSPGTATRRS